MVVVYDTAIRANGHVNAGLFKVLISCLADLDQRSCLTAADALGLSGDADRAAADTDLDKVRTAISQEAEAIAVNHVASAYLDAVTVMLTDPCNGLLLPSRKSLGGVDAQHVCAGLYQCGNSLCVVTGVDARADHVSLMQVQQFIGILLMGVVVLAEYECNQLAVLVHDGQGVELMIPDDVVCSLERGALGCGDQLFKGSHEFRNLEIGRHTADAVISTGHDAKQLAGIRTVIGYSHGGVAGLLLECQNIG